MICEKRHQKYKNSSLSTKTKICEFDIRKSPLADSCKRTSASCIDSMQRVDDNYTSDNINYNDFIFI